MSDKKKPKDKEEFLDESSENGENELDEFLDEEFDDEDTLKNLDFKNTTIT